MMAALTSKTMSTRSSFKPFGLAKGQIIHWQRDAADA
jgi:hypothetical protein